MLCYFEVPLVYVLRHTFYVLVVVVYWSTEYGVLVLGTGMWYTELVLELELELVLVLVLQTAKLASYV